MDTLFGVFPLLPERQTLKNHYNHSPIGIRLLQYHKYYKYVIFLVTVELIVI